MIVTACGCTVINDQRLRELHMGVLEGRLLEGRLTLQEEQWRKQIVDGTPAGCIPQGKSMEELCERMCAALESCLMLPAGNKPLIISHGITPGCLISSVLGLPSLCGTPLAPTQAQLFAVAP